LRHLLARTALSEGVVDWRVQFAEVFARGGFDVVLANPPYVRHELITDIKPVLKSAYGALYSGTADLYVYFYYRAVQLLRPGGMLVFISSNKWFRAAYGAKLRAHIGSACHVHSITDFGDLPVFESATAYPMIFVAQKGDAPVTATFLTEVKSLQAPYPDVGALIQQHGQRLPTSAIRGANWTLTDAVSADRLQQMRRSGKPLGEYVGGHIYRGVLTGLNKAFVIDSDVKAELIAADPRSEDIIKPFGRGKDIRRWTVKYQDKWLIFARHGTKIDDYPAIKEHLSKWREKLEPKPRGLPMEEERPGRKPGSYKWYEIQDDVAYYPIFEKTKIVLPDIAVGPRFALDTTGLYFGNTAYIIPVSDLYLLGVLNSSAALLFYLGLTAQVRGGYLRFFAQYLEQIPIPSASAADRDAIAMLVKKCLDANGQGSNIATWEAEINSRVAWLYGITEADVVAVEDIQMDVIEDADDEETS